MKRAGTAGAQGDGRAQPFGAHGGAPTMIATVIAAGIVQLPTAAIVVALPTIHAEFDTAMAELQWTITAFYIPFAALLIASGRIADLFGRKRLLLIGGAVFALGSALAAAAGDVQVLIAGIALSGIGGAMLMPSSMSLLTNLFTGTRRGVAIGYWGAATELVSGIGVLVGGVLTGELSWRWIFIVNIAFVVALALLAWRNTPESRDPNAVRKVDLPGAALTASGLTAITLALIQGSTWGWGSAAVIGLLAGGLVIFGALAAIERRSAHPIFDFGFFRQRNFTGATSTIFVIDFSFGAMLLFLPSYLQEILGYSAIETGALLLPLTGLMVVASPLGGRIAARTGPRPPIAVGLTLMAVAIFWISELSPSTDYGDLWAPTAIMGFGIGLALTPMNLAAMNAVSRDRAGAASGLLVTLSGLGATLGVAVTGAIFTQLQADRTQELVTDRGVPITSEQASELDGLLAGAPGSERTLDRIAGDRDAAEVRTATRDAYVSALGTAFKLSGALVVAGILLALVLLRRSDAADARAADVPVSSVTPRPAPRAAA